MTWKTVFKTYKEQEIVKKEKQVNCNTSQVSQFSLFLPLEEGSKSKNEISEMNRNNLKIFLGDDWDDYKDNPKALTLWINLLFKNHLMEQRKVPDDFTAITHCNSCGYVYVPPTLVNGGNVISCPWCWNRTKGLPIPKITTC